VVATLREQWPHLRLTLTADATQVLDLVATSAFGLLVLAATLPGRALPGLLAQLHRQHPMQRLLLLTDAPSPAGPEWAGAPLQLPHHVLPHALVAALAGWLEAPEAAAPATRPAPAYAVPTRLAAASWKCCAW
jgi:hypothetical protein